MSTCVVVEGRDGVGKTTLVRALVRCIARAQAVVVPRPTWDELRGSPFARFLERIRSGFVVLDRSWYTRASVEAPMGFCSARELETFLEAAPRFEEELVRSGVTLVKIHLDVSDEEQARRLLRRTQATLVDRAALARAGDFARAREDMTRRTSTPLAPWHFLRTDGDPEQTTKLALARIIAACREGEVDVRWRGVSCSSGFASSTSEEASSALRF